MSGIAQYCSGAEYILSIELAGLWLFISVKIIPAESYLTEVCVREYCYSVAHSTKVLTQEQAIHSCEKRAKFPPYVKPSDTYDFSELAGELQTESITEWVLRAVPIEWVLQWRHNERDGVWIHQHHDCLLNHLFKAQINENIKAPHRWPLCGEFTSHRWIPRTNGQ